MSPDYLIVGSGLTGATIARQLHDAGHSVLVVEQRDHVGGNVADVTHPSGIRMCRHGPHYFRTSSERIWEFAARFAEFEPFEAVVKTRVNGEIENWPIAASYIRRCVSADWTPEFAGSPANFEQAALSMMPRVIYERFVKGYTEKQWGVSATALAADLCRRFDVRTDDDPRLTPGKTHQGMPIEGYSRWVESMLAGVPVLLNFDFLSQREAFRPRLRTVFTGPIDAFYDYRFGRLAYRGQRRVTWFLPDLPQAQPCGQVNEPDSRVPYVRTIEWKHMLPREWRAQLRGTLLTREIPSDAERLEELEYPFPDAWNQATYERYRALAEADERVLICGRLGEYRYYDMDQAIGRALRLAERLLEAECRSLQFSATGFAD